MRTTTIAERLDHALDAMMDGAPPGRAAAGAGLTDAGRSLVVTADRLRHALPVPSVAPRFEARVGARLATSGGAADPMRWVLGHPGRLIVTGAVGSAVGVGVTAYAVWRSTRRPALRAWHR
jgi:hypothetical protein